MEQSLKTLDLTASQMSDPSFELRDHYLALAKRHHPDTCQNNTSKMDFSEIKEAYDFVRNNLDKVSLLLPQKENQTQSEDQHANEPSQEQNQKKDDFAS